MFAVREIIKDILYATELSDGEDAFTQCFIQWEDPSFIRTHLQSQSALREYYHVSIGEATRLILQESKQLFLKFHKIVSGELPIGTLDNMFIPLHANDDFTLQRVPAKAYGISKAKSFLRLYAIRFSDGCYLIIGGYIKLHKTMQQSHEGIQILRDFKIWSDYLNKKGIDGAFELVTLISEK